jgi:hypothetical protein
MEGNEALDLTVSGLPSTERIARRTLARTAPTDLRARFLKIFARISSRRFSLGVELWRVRLQEEPDTL